MKERYAISSHNVSELLWLIGFHFLWLVATRKPLNHGAQLSTSSAHHVV